MRNIVSIAGLSLTLAACADNPQKYTTSILPQVATMPEIDTAKSILPTVHKSPLNSDTLFITKQSAIFIRPDSFRIEEEKKKGNDEDFYVGANDYLYYMSTDQEFLDSVKVVVIDAENKKFIQFGGNNKKGQIINVSKLPELWNIYFFTPTKKAKRIDMTAIEEEYQAYFE
jgi:hypothetical protein